MNQAGILAPGQVDLGGVTGYHSRRAETDPGQEHLHLLPGGVLALVENNERIVQGTATHERQRRNLDHAFLDQAGDLLKSKHFIKRVVQRPKVRVHLLGQVAGQKTRSEEHTSELQSRPHLVCRLLLEKKKNTSATE